MREIDRILDKIESCIRESTYYPVETDRIEVKDLSSGEDWKELYKSACAFLNANGGILIIGIKEKNKNYQLTGFNPDNEEKIKELAKKFTNEDQKPLDLQGYFPSIEIKEMLDKRVCLVFVEKLPEEMKYVYYNKEAYERRLTGDHKIDKHKLQAQKELRDELANAREIQIVPTASLDNLNIDKLNDYLIRLNRDVKVESLKADIPSALSFLSRKNFIRDGKPTLLGLLVCGDNIYDFVQGRCQVDGFVESAIEIAQNKQIIKDNIIQLLEQSFVFVLKNIQVGVSAEKGGKSKPEYPEKLIRETVNNALAHRDYSSDRFVNIIIQPDQHIEIRNPGAFRADQKILIDQVVKTRRIIPNPKARNPRLADLLKSFDRWEGRGIGMASLTNSCLDNEIDVPFYILHTENDISLFVRKGKVLDEPMKLWLDSFSGFIYKQNKGRDLSEEQEIALAYFYKSELLNRQERYTIILTPDNNHFDVISTLEENGLIYRHPNSPDLYPVFLVNRVLVKNEYSNELLQIFGGAFDNLSNDYKDVLDATYQHNFFSREDIVSAKRVNNYLYSKKFGPTSDVKHYENYYRKIRTIFNNLEKGGFIVRADGSKPRFVLNTNFPRTPSLFD